MHMRYLTYPYRSHPYTTRYLLLLNDPSMCPFNNIQVTLSNGPAYGAQTSFRPIQCERNDQRNPYAYVYALPKLLTAH